MKHYRAPWSKGLVAISALATVFLSVVTSLLITISAFPATIHADHVPLWVGAMPMMILAGAALFTVRGYTITSTQIKIQRLLWNTSLSLNGLKSATVEPECMHMALRIWGNGGVFAFSGLYRNGNLGWFKAFVTDGEHTVVLRFSSKTVVVSPEDPEDFIQNLSGFCR